MIDSGMRPSLRATGRSQLELCSLAANKRHCSMAILSKHTWYVSFETPQARAGEKRPYSRMTRTFRNEGEAKDFAREKLQISRDVNAGTLNPYLPKRVITSAQVYEWLEATLGGESQNPGQDEVCNLAR